MLYSNINAFPLQGPNIDITFHWLWLTRIHKKSWKGYLFVLFFIYFGKGSLFGLSGIMSICLTYYEDKEILLVKYLHNQSLGHTFNSNLYSLLPSLLFVHIYIFMTFISYLLFVNRCVLQIKWDSLYFLQCFDRYVFC